MTNGDRFRAMTDEEMAERLAKLHCPPETNCVGRITCYDCWFNYLKHEISAPLQKDPLCDTCKHAVDGVVDDFATCYCPFHGYVGQKCECADYAPKEVSESG